MREAFTWSFTVATLLLGAGLTNFLRFSELHRGSRLDAADQLADLLVLLWDKTDPEAWLKLNVAISRLEIRLNLAGVNRRCTEELRLSAIGFWEEVEVVGQDERGDVWSVSDAAGDRWRDSSGTVIEILSASPFRRWRLQAKGR